jgi:hypothetical protein
MSQKKVNDEKACFLPAVAKTFAGSTFYPQDDIWEVWSASKIIRFDFLNIPGADLTLIPAMKMTFSWYVQHRAADHAFNLFERAKHFFREMLAVSGETITEINNFHLMNYRNSLGESKEWYLSSLAGLLKRWSAFGYLGIDASAIGYLCKVRLRGNQKGTAVLTMDPVAGPFTDLEFEAIHASLTEAFRTADLSLEDCLATRLFMALGQRPIQFALLKVRDLLVVNNPDGTVTYSLFVPRAKQRGVAPRFEFTLRPLISDVGVLLVEHCRRICQRFEGIIEDIRNAPMFPVEEMNPAAPEGLEWHIGSDSLSKRVFRAFGTIAPISERTGKPIHMTPMRFRRTIATRAAEEGEGILIIAKLLDHSDTQNAKIYVEARPDIIKRIDKAIAMQMAPLAQAFVGGVDADDDGSRPRIRDPRFDATRHVGSCGQHSHCAFSAPIACYTCAKFNAWVDGPHEAVLEFLVAEEERLARVADDTISRINRRTILAVAQVVQLCADRKRTERDHG